MKKIFFVLMALCFASSLAFANEEVKPADDKSVAVTTTVLVAPDKTNAATETATSDVVETGSAEKKETAAQDKAL
jgi:hypothetical protein